MDEPPSIHGTSSLRRATLYISSEIAEDELTTRRIIRKEAVSALISPKADFEVPQIHDVAWVVAGLGRNLWLRARVPPRRFMNYDPYVLNNLSERSILTLAGSLISVINSSLELGGTDFFTYFSILRRMLLGEVKLTQSDMMVLQSLSRNPSIRPRGIKEQLGISEPTISRSIRKLKSLGFLFGPENVNISKLGLATVLVEYPNSREIRRVFWEFPFTYNQMIPVSSDQDALALLVIPWESIPVLSKEMGGLGIRIYRSKYSFHDFQLAPTKDIWGAMARSMSEVITRRGYFCEGSRGRGVRLSKDDMKILNHVMIHGKVTLNDVKAIGVSSPKYRLSRLRERGFIMRRYLIEVPKGLDSLYLKVRCEESEFPRIARLIAAASTTTLHFVEGSGFRGCAGISFVRKEMKGDFAAGLSAVLGNRLKVITDIMDVNPLWLIPEELWDERSQKFTWEPSLSDLISQIYELLSGNEKNEEKR